MKSRHFQAVEKKTLFGLNLDKIGRTKHSPILISGLNQDYDGPTRFSPKTNVQMASGVRWELFCSGNYFLEENCLDWKNTELNNKTEDLYCYV